MDTLQTAMLKHLISCALLKAREALYFLDMELDREQVHIPRYAELVKESQAAAEYLARSEVIMRAKAEWTEPGKVDIGPSIPPELQPASQTMQPLDLDTLFPDPELTPNEALAHLDAPGTPVDFGQREYVHHSE